MFVGSGVVDAHPQTPLPPNTPTHPQSQPSPLPTPPKNTPPPPHTHSRNPVLRQRPVCDMHALSTQLVHIAESLRAPEAESRGQQEAFQGVKRIVQQKWPHAQLELFGSAANGLSIGQNNDIDVCLVLDAQDSSQVCVCVVGCCGCFCVWGV